MKKDKKNINVVVHKLRLVLIGVTNHRFEVARKENQKTEEMMEKQKRKAMAAK